MSWMRHDVAVDMTISHEPAADGWPSSWGPSGRDHPKAAALVHPRVDRRPEVAFAVGAAVGSWRTVTPR